MGHFLGLSPDLFCIANFEGRFTRVNAAWEEKLGYREEELISVPYTHFVHPEDVAATFAEAGKLNEGGATVMFENRYRCKDGRYIWLLWHAKPDLEKQVIYAVARDITPQKTLEQELLAKSRLQQALLDSTDFIIISADSHGVIQSFNTAAQRNLGYTAEEVIGRATPALFHDANEMASHARLLSRELGRHVSPGFEVFAARAMLGLPEEGEWTYVRKDGTRYPGRSSVTALRDEHGQFAGIMGVSRNITDWKLLEHELRETASLQRAILDSANFTIISTRPDGVIQTVNAGALRELGYAPEEVIGRVTPELIHDPHEVRRHAEALSVELGTYVEPGFETFVAKARLGEVDENEWTYIRKDGSRYPVLLSVTALRDESGAIAGFVGVASNISERKRAQAARRDAEAKLQGILDNAPAVMFIKDVEGRYVLVNKRWGELFHVTPEQIIGLTDQDIFPADMAHAFRENDLKVQSGGVPLTLEEIAPQDDGPHTYLSVKFPLWGPDGELTAVGGIATDITDRKRAENDLRRSNEALEQFAYVASHDLQEPLRIVVSYLQLLERRYKEQLNAEAREFIDTAVSSARHMRALLHDLLEFSRIGRRSGPLTSLDSGAALDVAVTNLRLTIEETGATIHRETDLPRVFADRSQLIQVFQNLLGNAIRYRGDKPPVIHVGAHREKGWWILSVKDEGIGIDPKFHDRIFAIFQRLEARNDGGTGIGLAICKRIIEGHGGSIWVQSTQGEGATFFFKLRGT